MSEDFSRTNEVVVSNRIAYSHINDLLNKEGRSLADFTTMEQRVEQYILCNTNNEVLPLQRIAEIGQ